MRESPHSPSLTVRNQSQTNDSVVRPSWGQVAIMLVGSILVVVIVASIATAPPFWLPSGSWATHMLVVLSPGYLLSALIAPFLSSLLSG